MVMGPSKDMPMMGMGMMGGGPMTLQGLNPMQLMMLSNANPQDYQKLALQFMAMNSVPTAQAISNFESQLPQNLQYANADNQARIAGEDYTRSVLRPEMAKAQTATRAGGLGASTSSFQAAKQGALQAALMRNRESVQNDARTAGINQINMMRSGTFNSPYSGGGQSQFNNAFSLPQSIQTAQMEAGYGQNPYGTAEKIGAGVGNVLDFLSQAKQNYGAGQNPIPTPSWGGLPGALGRVGAGIGNFVLNRF